MRDLIKLNITDLDSNGLGVAHYQGKKILVNGALPDETILVSKDNCSQLIEIIQPSPLRINPPCKLFNKCGGCNIQHIDNYHEYKTSLVKKLLEEINFSGILHPLITTPSRSRRRASFKVKNYQLSFNQYHSKLTVAIDDCLLLEDDLNQLIRPINLLLYRLKIQIYEVNLVSSDSGVEVILYSQKNHSLEHNNILSEFAYQYNISRIIWHKNTPSIIIQIKPVELHFNNIKVDLPIRSFLQVSKSSMEIMNNIIKKHINVREKLLELYCGCGSFTLNLANLTKITAIEGHKESILALIKAANRYNLKIEARCQDLYNRPIKSNEIDNYKQILINPPRNGATPQIKEIAKSKNLSDVIFVSCSLVNFVRDTKILLEAGFYLKEIYPIDQFLYTTHLELIAIFQKHITF
jgi:23S rRNA (uracil1939-C5)-methyltransferase